MRSVGLIDGAYVLSVFDCCREALQANMRGDGAILSGDDTSDVDPQYQNSCIWFGCPPLQGVDQKSTFAKKFFKKIRKAGRKNYEGKVIFPRDI